METQRKAEARLGRIPKHSFAFNRALGCPGFVQVFRDTTEEKQGWTYYPEQERTSQTRTLIYSIIYSFKRGRDIVRGVEEAWEG